MPSWCIKALRLNYAFLSDALVKFVLMVFSFVIKAYIWESYLYYLRIYKMLKLLKTLLLCVIMGIFVAMEICVLLLQMIPFYMTHILGPLNICHMYQYWVASFCDVTLRENGDVYDICILSRNIMQQTGNLCDDPFKNYSSVSDLHGFGDLDLAFWSL